MELLYPLETPFSRGMMMLLRPERINATSIDLGHMAVWQGEFCHLVDDAERLGHEVTHLESNFRLLRWSFWMWGAQLQGLCAHLWWSPRFGAWVQSSLRLVNSSHTPMLRVL